VSRDLHPAHHPWKPRCQRWQGNIHRDHGDQKFEQEQEVRCPQPSRGVVHASGVRGELGNEAIIGLVGRGVLLKALLVAAAEMAKLGGLWWVEG
jgi:hypothetical protein